MTFFIRFIVSAIVLSTLEIEITRIMFWYLREAKYTLMQIRFSDIMSIIEEYINFLQNQDNVCACGSLVHVLLVPSCGTGSQIY